MRGRFDRRTRGVLVVVVSLLVVGGLILAILTLRSPKDAGELAAPSDKFPPPSGWNEQALASFSAAGIAPPRTVMTAEVTGDLELDWIRQAIAEAGKVDPERLKALGGSEEDRASDDAEATAESAPGEMLFRDEDGVRESERLERPASPEGSEESGDAATVIRRGAPAPGAVLAESEFDATLEVSSEGAGGSLSIDFADEEEEEPAAPEGTAVPKLLARTLGAPRIGKILFQNEDGKYESLVPRALRIQVFLEGPRARTVVDYVFSNPHDRVLQGTFYYPLPAGASPAAFAMFRGTAQLEEADFAQGLLLPSLPDTFPHDFATAASLVAVAPRQPSLDDAEVHAATLVKDWGEIQIARIVAQTRARQVYEQIVRKNIDPALLEWSGANTFQARVFPIEARSVKRVVLVYEETLGLGGDLVRYSFPLPAAKELGSIGARIHVHDGSLKLSAVVGREKLPEARQTTDGWTSYDLTCKPAPDVTLDIALKAPRPSAQVIEGGRLSGLEGGAFFARLRPTFTTRNLKDGTRRALFLIDTSLSEAGLRHGLSVELFEKILSSDDTIEEYAVLLFDLRPRWLHALGWRQNTVAARQESLGELGKIFLEGATSFDATLDELDRQRSWLLEKSKPVHAFLLSDGQITWGQDRVEELAKAHPAVSAVRWLCYRFGTVPVNQDLFDGLARASGGRAVTVLTRAEIEAGARAHRSAPAVLERVAVEGAEVQDIVVAGDPKLLFPGQELQVAGRLAPRDKTEVHLVVEANLDGEKRSWREPLASSGDSRLAWRAWAELHVRRLLALDDERLDRMVVALSQEFALANSAASMLILEDDEEYEEYQIEDETVDLENLEQLRIKEEDQRRDRLQGLALDDVPSPAVELIRALEAHATASEPTQQALPFLDRPLAGGEKRIGAEQVYRQARAKDAMDIKVYDAVARARALAGDTAGALRAYSCVVEKRPASAEAARLVGYACLALGQYVPAVELFQRVRLRRPFEPQSYLEEALALEASGDWGRAARNFEILLAREFPRHQKECRTTGAYHYARLLKGRLREGRLEGKARELAARRVDELSKILAGDSFEPRDLELSIHWNTDSTDIDLWILEPEGERCYYKHKQTTGGGRLFWDTTDGYGPELYQRRKAASGAFEVMIHYYGNNSPRWSVPTAVLFVRDRKLFGPEDGYTRQYRMRLLPEQDAVLSLAQEEF